MLPVNTHSNNNSQFRPERAFKQQKNETLTHEKLNLPQIAQFEKFMQVRFAPKSATATQSLKHST